MAHHDEFEGFEQGTKRPAACVVCETMLPEAVDGTLSASEQRVFDAHIAGCTACSMELAEAQRGAAWLGMLKSTPPEPPASLLAKILAETSEAALTPLMRDETTHERGTQGVVAIPPVREVAPHGWAPTFVPAPGLGARLLAFRKSITTAFSMEHAQSVFQPRMAMTAAMAFFSIALTLNLTGVHLGSMHAEDFTPSGLRRMAADTTASLTRTFQNDRTVYQVESRLNEFDRDDAPAQEGRSGR